MMPPRPPPLSPSQVRILRTFDHPNIIEAYLFYRDDPKYFFLVLEHLSGPELFDYVSAKVNWFRCEKTPSPMVLLLLLPKRPVAVDPPLSLGAIVAAGV